MNTTEKLAFALLAAANYIDALGGVSAQYRQTLAAYESELAATPASQAPAPAHEVPDGEAAGQAVAEDDRVAFRQYLAECDDCAIVPDVAGAFNWAWQRAPKSQPKGAQAAAEGDALSIAREALDEIALAGMSGSGQESEEGMRAWHARQAWRFIGIAARAIDKLKVRAALESKAQPKGTLTDPEVATILARLPVLPTGDGSKLHDWAMSAVRELHAATQAPAQHPTQGAERVPLTQKEIIEEFCKRPHQVQFVCNFEAGVRFAEDHHGISASGGEVQHG